MWSREKQVRLAQALRFPPPLRGRVREGGSGLGYDANGSHHPHLRPLPAKGRGAARLAATLLIAGLTAGCFQPLYGERSLTGTPALRSAMAQIDVSQIDAAAGTSLARLAVEVRNELLFGLTGGSAAPPPTHRLRIALSGGYSSLIVDPSTARAEYELVSMDASYKLIEIATGKEVVDGAATARTSYNVPGQQQRLAMTRGQRDAQSRAARLIAEQIKTRMASYFATGA
jgi:LPS-assembly lipoprotein